MTPDLPVMGMGLIGFGPQQQAYLSNILKARAKTLRWEPRGYLEADALWINGERVQALGGGLIRVPSQMPTSGAVRLNLQETDRPVAFASPLAAGFEFPHVFDPFSPDSVAAILSQFESALHLPTALLALAATVCELDGTPPSPVYHLVLQGKLIAVINLRGEVGLAPGTSAADVETADWHGMPAAAGDVPQTFQCTSIAEVMWQYAARAPRDVLPDRYRTKPIYFRHAPTVRQALINDSHLVVARELALKPQRFAELLKNTGLGDVELARALAALYYVGSITSDAKRAAPGSGSPSLPAGAPASAAKDSPEWSASVPYAASEQHPASEQDWPVPKPRDINDMTAPAALRRDRKE